MAKLRIRTQKPYIAYPGSTVQQNYAEPLKHGYLLWDITDRDDFDVTFRDLPNPKPFVTIDWRGNVSDTLSGVSFPQGTRFRIRSEAKIPSKDSLLLTETLKKDFTATEVTFKDDHHVDRTHVSTGMTTVMKEDLRSPDVLLNLLQEHYAGSDMHDEEWHAVYDLLRKYLGVLSTDTQTRNVTWTIRNIEFSNLFGYGDNNKINFDKMSGLVGIFGPNRSGKSSIPGALMYSLYNGTDRGVIKNKDVVNSRKDEGMSRIVFNVNGSDYISQRTTTKTTNKHGVVNAATNLQLYRIHENMELEDLSGEQRPDTDKRIKQLIGDKDDFLLTSLSSQGENNVFLKNGPTKRRQTLSRFLDVDVLHKIHELANQDIKELRAVLRSMKDKNWVEEERTKKNKIDECKERINTLETKIGLLRSEAVEFRTQLARHSDVIPVTKDDVTSQESIVNKIRAKLSEKDHKLKLTQEKIHELKQKIMKLDSLLEQYNLSDMKKELESCRSLQVVVDNLKSVFNAEKETLKRHKHTLKVLDVVPCGDQFPSCRFIKDAHNTKMLLAPQQAKVEESQRAVEEAQKSIAGIDVSSLHNNIKKIEKLKDRRSQLQLSESRFETEEIITNNNIVSLGSELNVAETRLEELRDALFNDENEEVASLRMKIRRIENELHELEKQKMSTAASQGKIQSELDQLLRQKIERQSILFDMKAHEVIFTGFSRKGVPNLIMSSLLPVINEEINKVLHGIVNFTIELEKDVDSDHVDIMLNYGDSRRILELGSGHEKMISSIALRVALINSSSLPKTDIFIIDEGFGAFDAQGIDECNRLLQSLKRYFKTVLIITHVDAIKEVVDTLIEITRLEKDSQVRYE